MLLKRIPGSVEQTLADTIHSMVQAGHLPAKLAGELVTATFVRQSGPSRQALKGERGRQASESGRRANRVVRHP